MVPRFAHGRIADHRRHFDERGDQRRDRFRIGDGDMTRHRADRRDVAGDIDAAQVEVAEIDDVGGRGEALLHRRQQRHAAGEQLAILTVARQARGFVDRTRLVILKGVHALAPAQLRAPACAPACSPMASAPAAIALTMLW